MRPLAAFSAGRQPARHRIVRLASIACLYALLVLCPSGPAQAASPLAGPDTSSPRATLETFLEGARTLEERYTRYRADKSRERAEAVFRSMRFLRRTFDLSETARAVRAEVGENAVSQLMDILLRLPPIDLATVPGGPDADRDALPERWTIPETEIQIVRIDEGARVGEYLFASDTVERLPVFHDLIIDREPVQPTAYDNWYRENILFTGPMVPYGLVAAIPDPLNTLLLGTPLWKVIMMSVLYIVVLAVVIALTVFVYRQSRELGPVRQRLCRLAAPLVLWSLVALLHTAIPGQLNLSGPFAEGEFVAASILTDFAVAWAIWIASFLVVELIIALPAIPDSSYDAHLLRLVARVTAFIGVAAVAVLGADEVGIPALGVIAGLGVGGFALALAAQSTQPATTSSCMVARNAVCATSRSFNGVDAIRASGFL